MGINRPEPASEGTSFENALGFFDKDYGIKSDELDIHKVLNWKGGVRNESNKKFNRQTQSQEM